MRSYFVLGYFLIVTGVAAQQTRVFNDPDLKFREAQAYFQQEQYSLAFPLLQELRASITETQRVNDPVTCQEILYYHTVCALMLNDASAETAVQQYIITERNESRVQRLRYQLGNYYFRMARFADAARAYEQAGIANLSNDEIATLRFRQGYCYFTQQRFEEARPLFNSVRSLKGDPHYLDAQDYYGFLLFRDRRFSEALECFRAVENEPAYAAVVPYYIAQIQYIQGRKEEAIP